MSKIRAVLGNLGLWLQRVFLAKEALFPLLGLFLVNFFLIAMIILLIVETLKITERKKEK